VRILIVPGLNGSGPDHWQTLWERQYGYERVHQRNWENPDLAEWLNTMNTAIMASRDRAVLVAHSLGCLTAAHWAKTFPENMVRIQCALLVAPPDVESSPYIPEALHRFASYATLPFPSVLVGSENDHYMTLDSVRRLADLWGSRFVNAGACGHINPDSGHGPWPEGEALLQDLLRATN
jgi:predicted alpha/beta hydrolase family esterase